MFLRPIDAYPKETVGEPKKQRFESRAELPPLLELEAAVIYPEPVNSKENQSTAYWVGNSSVDFSKSSDGPFIAPQKPGAWLTTRSRSVYVPQEKGFLQIKGVGNFDKPNFPPLINLTDHDIGHQFIWSVGASETVTVDLFSKLFAEVGVDFTPLQKALKLLEIPVPINGRGGLEIRSVVDALLVPWEYADHVRGHMLGQIRKLLIQKYAIPSDLPDEVVALFFQKQEGFYQLHIEQQLPFRNDIGSLINMPILLDYLSGNKLFSLESQAQKIVWVFKELGKFFGISELSDLVLPDLTGLVEQVTVIEDLSYFDNESKHLDFRKFYNTTSEGMSAKNIQILKKHYGISDDQPLLQIKSDIFIEKLFEQIPEEKIKQFTKEIGLYQEKLIINYVQAIVSGMSLSQSIGSKDAILGKVGDIAAAGVPSSDTSDIDRFAELLRKSMINDESMCLGSCFDLMALMYGKKSLDNVYLWKAIEVKFARILTQLAATKNILIPSLLQEKVGDNYSDVYVQAITKLVEEAKQNLQLLEELKNGDSTVYHEALTALMKKIPYFILARAGGDYITKALVS